MAYAMLSTAISVVPKDRTKRVATRVTKASRYQELHVDRIRENAQSAS